jgi:hypothetical protein
VQRRRTPVAAPVAILDRSRIRSSGSFREGFDGPTTTVPQGQLVAWSTRHLADELRAPGMLLALAPPRPGDAGAAPWELWPEPHAQQVAWRDLTVAQGKCPYLRRHDPIERWRR